MSQGHIFRNGVVVTDIIGVSGNIVTHDAAGKLIESGVNISQIVTNTQVTQLSGYTQANTNSINTLFSTYANSTTVAAVSAGLNTRLSAAESLDTTQTNSINTLFSTYANSTTVAAISAGVNTRLTNVEIKSFGVSIDGGGSVPTSGSMGFWRSPNNGVIQSWSILSDVSGSCVVDVRKSTYSSFPTTSSIAGSEKPTLSSARKNEDTNLTTWTTSISTGDIVEFVLESASTVTKINVIINWRVV